jgi:hypothetical protein
MLPVSIGHLSLSELAMTIFDIQIRGVYSVASQDATDQSNEELDQLA